MKICHNCNRMFSSDDWHCPNCNSRPHSEDSFLVFAPESNFTDAGFKPEFFEKLFNLEANNFWFKVRNQLIVWALNKYFPGKETFLEIGCGTGFVLSEIESQIPQLSLSGSEIHVDGLNFAKKRLQKTRLWQMDARSIPFENEFDVIGAFDVLEHIQEDEKVLQEMHKALCPGGGIVLTVPQHPFLWSEADEHACHERRYTAAELKSKVEKAGFTTVRTTSFVSFLLPFMMASRLMRRPSSKKYDPFAELKINSVLNRVFERVLKLEAAMIRAGISLPLGGSLLLIAFKANDK
jgi:SAM-dependent methyltransferase